MIASIDELARLPVRGSVHRPTILCSAKEAVFKAWYPRSGQRLEFADAEVELDPGSGCFVARLFVEGRTERLHGRFAATGDHLFTGVHVTPITRERSPGLLPVGYESGASDE